MASHVLNTVGGGGGPLHLRAIEGGWVGGERNGEGDVAMVGYL